jgi:hypothetical protein
MYVTHSTTVSTAHVSGFGGLGVSMLASGTQVRGFEPGLSRRIFQGEKILSMPSFGEEVKPSVKCCRSAARKRTLHGLEIAYVGKIMRHIVICDLSGSTIFSTLPHKGHEFRGKRVIVYKMRVLMFSTNFV